MSNYSKKAFLQTKNTKSGEIPWGGTTYNIQHCATDIATYRLKRARVILVRKERKQINTGAVL